MRLRSQEAAKFHGRFHPRETVPEASRPKNGARSRDKASTEGEREDPARDGAKRNPGNQPHRGSALKEREDDERLKRLER